MLIPFAILSLLSILLLLLSLRGRRIDTHPTCRRCKFDLIGLPSTTCPECGANLDAPKSTRIGNRRRIRSLAILSFFFFLIGAAGSGLSIYGKSRNIDWYTYKPVWWLRLDARYGSLDTVTHATKELLSRHDNNKLTQSDLDSVVSTLASALESAHLPTPVIYGHTLSELLTSDRLSRQSRDRLIAWLLTIQADATKPWSTELGSAFLAECLAKRIPHNLMHKFYHQSFAPRLETIPRRALRPGESVLVVLALSTRSGDSFGELSWAIDGIVSESEYATIDVPENDLILVGVIQAPMRVGTHVIEGTIDVKLGPDEVAPLPQPPARFGRRTGPVTMQNWPVRLTFEVAESPLAKAVPEFATGLFWVGDVQQNSFYREHQCEVMVFVPSIPAAASFEVFWKYEGKKIAIGQGNFDIGQLQSTNSIRTLRGSGHGSSTGSISEYTRHRTQKFPFSIPNRSGRDHTGTIVIHVTKLEYSDAPSEPYDPFDKNFPRPFTPFDLEFPNIKIHW